MSKSQPSQHNEFLLTTLPESYLSEQVYCRTCKLPLTRQEYYDRHSRHNIDDSYNPKNYPDPKKNEVKPPSFLSPNSITNGRVIPKQYSKKQPIIKENCSNRIDDFVPANGLAIKPKKAKKANKIIEHENTRGYKPIYRPFQIPDKVRTENSFMRVVLDVNNVKAQQFIAQKPKDTGNSNGKVEKVPDKFLNKKRNKESELGDEGAEEGDDENQTIEEKAEEDEVDEYVYIQNY